MQTKEQAFTLRFSLSATIPDALWDDDDFDDDAWRTEWEAQIKPGLIRAVFTYLRSFADWDAHIRNRGVSPEDEVEVVLARHVAPPTQQ